MLKADPDVAGGRAGHLAAAIAMTDFLRRSPSSIGGQAGHKEWQHFAILARDVDLLVNFSLCDDVRPGAEPGAETPRIVVLVRERGAASGRGGVAACGWDGDVESFRRRDAIVRGGALDLDLAHNRLRFDDAFHVDVALGDRPIRIALRLRPLTMPAFVPGIPMLDGPPLSWVVVPRLEVTGTLAIGDRDYALDGAPAYHDHNWGHFLWGHDVAWEWGFVLPDDAAVPWCVTFVRLTNRARTLALAHKVLVWRGADLVRVFREGEVRAETALGYLRRPSLFKIPRALALTAPGSLADVPAWMETRAVADADRLECRSEPFDVAQVLIPSETELGVTIFNEVAARTHVRGRIAGEAVEFSGRSIMEFIRHA
ncbi:MAG TPA: hypothetical protein VFD92_06830 [Candidatus Binatia bacterium]|nr:hypothetical protein [Candidatus Binatia bacterium]